MPRKHGLARALRESCTCYECWMALAQTRDWERRYLAGETLEEIGDSADLTRERIRQCLNMLNGGSSMAAEKRRRRRMKELEAASDAFHSSLTVCVICGIPTPNPTTCGGPCADDYAKSTLRYHADDDRRANQKRAIARWTLNNETDPIQLRHARRVLDGDDEPYGGRWLVEGSQSWELAMRAFLRGGSVVADLPESIVTQLRHAAQRAGLVPGDDWRESLPKCEHCKEPFDGCGETFCSRGCFYKWRTGRPRSASAKASR